MGTRDDIMRHAGILPIELPSGAFIGAVPAWPVTEPDEPHSYKTICETRHWRSKKHHYAADNAINE